MRFLIYAPSFDEKSGGVIALYLLCDCINKLGYEAYIAPFCFSDYPLKNTSFFSKLGSYVKHQIRRKEYKMEELNTPVWDGTVDEDFVVVYPEVVVGNPLGASNLVRWLLFKPDPNHHLEFDKQELVVCYNSAFNDTSINKNELEFLTTLLVKDDIYYDFGETDRKGVCYILRKGANLIAKENLRDGIVIDGKSHAEVAKIFNKVDTCISYDPYTMYSYYAVLCGCSSIVIPIKGVEKSQWLPKEENRYGLAYGFDDTVWAEDTSKLLLPYLKTLEQGSELSVKNFISLCHAKFFS